MKKTLFILTVALAATSTTVHAQKLKDKLKEKMNGVSENSKQEEAAPKLNELNEWHTKNQGSIVFYEKSIEYGSSSSSDNEYNMVTEREIGGSKPFGFRAYLGKPYNTGCETCANIEVKYSIDGVSVTTQQLREELRPFYGRMASGLSFYDDDNYTVGISLNAAPGKYFENYTLQEDAYRILLSRVKDKLTYGATVNMKVEIFPIDGDGVIQGSEALAVGEIPLKVTDASYNLQNLNCRCGKEGMNDEKVKKDVIEAFEFQFDDVVKVHQVVLNDRDWTMNYDNSYPTKQIIAKGMNANIVYERNDGVFMQVKRYVYYDKTPDGFADKAKIGKHVYFAPVSPTCGGKK